MYSLFVRNTKGFLAFTKPDSYTYKCFKVIKILADKDEFEDNKRNNSNVYKNAKILVKKAEELKYTKKYHRFDVFLRELEGEGFIFDGKPAEIEVNEDELNEQISLLWQCLFFNYVIA